MNKIIKYILFVIILLFFNYSFSQECDYEKDTLYLISVNATPINNIPKNICCLTKNIDNIKVSGNNWRSFIDTLFTSIVYSKYVFFGFSYKMDCYIDSSDNFIDKIITEFLEQQKEMYKKEKYVFKKSMLKDSSTITISIVKVAGEFWKLTDIEKSINNNTHQIHIDLNTYGYDYYYIFKKINDSWEVSDKDIVLLLNKFKKAGIKLKHIKRKYRKLLDL